jgi:hypothetical protein
VARGGPPARLGAKRTGIGRVGEPSGTTELARLRAENAWRDRLTALQRRVYAHGARLSVELVLRLSELPNADDLLEQLATRFVIFDPAFLRDYVGHEFPPSPIRLISQGG